MEWQEMMITPDQLSAGLQDVFAKFYGLDRFPTFDEAKKGGEEMIKLYDGFFFGEVFVKRMEISAETFLLEANQRGEVR